MKKILLLLSFTGILITGAYCQSGPEKEVAAAVEGFKKAIVDGDRAALNALSSDQVVFAHSSGKIQNKSEFVEELAGLKPNDYTKVNTADQKITVSGNTAVVTHIYSADFTTDGKPGTVKIGVMLIWQKTKGKWLLLARQAYKLPV